MISSVRGQVLAISLDHVVVDVGGVGLAVLATPATLATLRVGEQATLHTQLVVREDSLTLYGFVETESRELFVLLQSVSGIGPRLALATLAVLDPDTLCSALAEGNTTVLTQVPGIGKKGAERLSLELRDKVNAVAGAGAAGAGSAAAPGSVATSSGVKPDVVEALVSLGFAARQAEKAVDGVLDNGGGDADTSAVLRAALGVLGKKR
ncbi:MAG: Holliday junction branch migration protein RuvA [Actinophytocola sp.]|nr:Holliday junction branch migration protein RuvA [Actinophytocola sp.]